MKDLPKKVKDDASNEDIEELKAIMESVYTKSIELSSRTKTISLLKELYEVSILALDPKEMTTKVSQVIQAGLQFELVGIFFFDDSENQLSLATLATSDRLEKIRSHLAETIEDVSVDIKQFPLVEKVVHGKETIHTDNLSDVWGAFIPEDALSELQTDGHIKLSLVSPLISNEKVIGVLVFSLNRPYEDLVTYERESIQSFTDVVAVAINKAITDEQIKDLNRRLKSVISILSHDVKGVLGKNKDMFLALLEEDYGPVPEAVKPYLQASFIDTRKLIDSVMAILDSGHDLVLKPVAFDLKATIIEEVERVKKDAADKNITVETDIKDGDFTITADKDQLTIHVLRNLIENGINYNVRNGHLTVELSKKDDSTYLFKVVDTGVGISKEDQKNLFKEGGHGKDSIKINVHSSGYGLSSAKRTVDAHGGNITYETEEGKGTTFFVELPTVTEVATTR